MVPLSAVLIAFNEEKTLEAALRSVSFCDEIVLVDSGSSDRTCAIAEQAGARVIVNAPWPGFVAQRDFAVRAARHDWVLALDADERVGPALAEELGRLVADGTVSGHEAYAVRRNNEYLGRRMRYAGWGDSWAVRLFQRDRRFVEKRVHEGLEPVPDVGRLRNALDHTPYRDLAHHVRKLVLYAEWGALDMRDAGRRARGWDLVLRPPWQFFRTYVLQLGLLEGWRGLVLCGLAGVSVFLKYARAWDLQRSA